MVEAAKQTPFTDVSEDLKDKVKLKDGDGSAFEIINSRRSRELIIALCGAIGSDVNKLKETLISKLTNCGYKIEYVKLSEIISNQHPDPDKINAYKGYEHHYHLQELGNGLRKKYEVDGVFSIIAEMAITNISARRDANFGQEAKENKIVKTQEKVAYIIDQLKHPDEVDLFKVVYGSNFYLIGMLRTIEERTQSLEDEGMAPAKVAELISRDKMLKDADGKKIKHGQNVEETLQKSDYFIRNTDLSTEIESSVERFIKLIHGVNHITPTRDEVGMYAAHSASFRSACLSRQVGSAITDDNGIILATGCNDVPKFGGGLYTAESRNDKRCFNKDGCYNDKHKNLLKEEIKSILTKFQINESELIADKIMSETKAKSLIEYSRAIHAEMDAIISLARNSNASVENKVLYCTTYPCHNCARHIVAAGIKRVVYIEPYEKSLARQLHSDSISHTEHDANKVAFQCFEGVSPSRYDKFFKYHSRRKDSAGKTLNNVVFDLHHVDPSYLDSYFEYEKKIAIKLTEKTKTSGKKE
ncbi:TPA: anti-phage dCTP deaminase [Yersinia enterocolitica]|uniref:Deoxycytidylate deaminase n=1 Tax=Yersinia intermedia TaxID=631 RepID=A0ABX6F471_YERIN|nr:anti-phage dCTP deaminase [Yersinia intermedia]HDL6695317.1 deoxycytidylate deaminase [Yersinia enterocolitica]QGR64640.1 deoxycytidylate deaminase [Yersinia intermedia]QGR69656.1 deoxycytidylate deaminase [Yersinia intermedia]CNJ91836.1 ComE operon protein 2 [Yersinia intermedia]HDU2632210.1 deoxycytidylate deaminase [Yersinia enterocolitica]